MKTQKGPESYTAGLCLSWNLNLGLLMPSDTPSTALGCLPACLLQGWRGNYHPVLAIYQAPVAYELALPPTFVIVNADNQSLYSFHWSWTRPPMAQTLLPVRRNCLARRCLFAFLATAVFLSSFHDPGELYIYVCVCVCVCTCTQTDHHHH